jgi:hypothetical protein
MITIPVEPLKATRINCDYDWESDMAISLYEDWKQNDISTHPGWRHTYGMKPAINCKVDYWGAQPDDMSDEAFMDFVYHILDTDTEWFLEDLAEQTGYASWYLDKLSKAGRSGGWWVFDFREPEVLDELDDYKEFYYMVKERVDAYVKGFPSYIREVIKEEEYEPITEEGK